MNIASRVNIEQAIARGNTNRWIMDAYSITYRSLRLIKDSMNDGTGTKADPVPPKQRGRAA